MSYGDSQNDRRDVFAGLAMQAIIIQDDGMCLHPAKISEWAYCQANAMLAEREKHLTKATK